MKLFIDYQNHNLTAMLNWRLDYYKDCKTMQIAYDFLTFGKAYLANAIISLDTLCKSENIYNQADVLIFPILFDVWHSLELLLKSGKLLCKLINEPAKEHAHDSHHNIYTLFGEFKKEIATLGLKKSAKIYLKEVSALIKEFDTQKANFDFARYSIDKKTDSQFYNRSYKERGVDVKSLNIDKRALDLSTREMLEKLVPNTGVDMLELKKCLNEIMISFSWFIDALFRILSNDDEYYHGKMPVGFITDELIEKDRKLFEDVFMPTVFAKPKEEQLNALVHTFLLM